MRWPLGPAGAEPGPEKEALLAARRKGWLVCVRRKGWPDGQSGSEWERNGKGKEKIVKQERAVRKRGWLANANEEWRDIEPSLPLARRKTSQAKHGSKNIGEKGRKKGSETTKDWAEMAGKRAKKRERGLANSHTASLALLLCPPFRRFCSAAAAYQEK